MSYKIEAKKGEYKYGRAKRKKEAPYVYGWIYITLANADVIFAVGMMFPHLYLINCLSKPRIPDLFMKKITGLRRKKNY